MNRLCTAFFVIIFVKFIFQIIGTCFKFWICISEKLWKSISIICNYLAYTNIFLTFVFWWVSIKVLLLITCFWIKCSIKGTCMHYLSSSSSVRASVLCSPVARASSSFRLWTSLFSFCIINLGSSSSLTITSFLIIATLCAKRQVDIDS